MEQIIFARWKNHRFVNAKSKERDLTDLAYYRGQIPPEAEFIFVDPDPDYDAESLALYSQDPAELSDTQIKQALVLEGFSSLAEQRAAQKRLWKINAS